MIAGSLAEGQGDILHFLGWGDLRRFEAPPWTPGTCLPFRSCSCRVVYRGHSLNSCPPGLALALASGLWPGRHPDRLQMSVGVGLHRALVLGVSRGRRINGLHLRASPLGPSSDQETEAGTSGLPSPRPPPQTQGSTRKGGELAFRAPEIAPLHPPVLSAKEGPLF